MRQQTQRGAVSIFIVVFTALLVTIVTTSFIQIMLRNQEQASENDLSQSAYDSALAGVEDAKRALVKYKKCQNNASDCGAGENAAGMRSKFDSGSCKTLENVGAATFNANNEVMVGDSAELNQAYTCVKVKLQTESLEGELTGDLGTDLKKLQGEKSYDKIRIYWFNRSDLKQAADPSNPTTPPSAPVYETNPTELLAKNSWSPAQPSVLRVQSIQFKQGNLKLSDFNKEDTQNAKTMFLYPTDTTVSPSLQFDVDKRRKNSNRNDLKLGSCGTNFNKKDYACMATIDVASLDLVDDEKREAYLQLAALYNQKTSYMIELLKGDDEVVKFDGVQPRVDATGRASDIFRRVSAKVSLADGGQPQPYPHAAMSVRNNFCKDFFVTNDEADYKSDTDTIACEP